MNNAIRVVLAILATIGAIAVLAVLLPLALGAALLVSGVLAVGLVIFGLATIIAFFWYISRKEKEEKRKGNYSLDQGKEM